MCAIQEVGDGQIRIEERTAYYSNQEQKPKQLV